MTFRILRSTASWIVLAACSAFAAFATLPARAATPSDAAQGWLAGQKGRSGLYASFEGGTVAYTYDQAVAAIAFLVKGDITRSRALLTKLQSLQGADGAFCNAYYASNGVKQEAAKTVGPNMWVAIAVMDYEKWTGDRTTYHAMATKAIAWALQFQQSDGGLDGGRDASGALLTYASTEHNLDAYAALSWFGYPAQAAAVKSFLDNVVWSVDHFLVARPNGDTNDALDVDPWGVMALGTSGTRPYANALAYAMTHQRTTRSSGGTSYDAFDYNADRNDIWFEGSNFMVIALALAGDSTDSTRFLAEIEKNQAANGGVQYSLLGTNNGYWTMSTAHAISSTGWLVLAIAGYNPLAH